VVGTVNKYVRFLKNIEISEKEGENVFFIECNQMIFIIIITHCGGLVSKYHLLVRFSLDPVLLPWYWEEEGNDRY
jgi:hypothetical protein